jgi:hypothetical protein
MKFITDQQKLLEIRVILMQSLQYLLKVTKVQIKMRNPTKRLHLLPPRLLCLKINADN